MLVKYSVALVALPGGLGTLDAVFGSLTLTSNGDLRDFPIVLVGERYWRPLIHQIGAAMARVDLADAVDLGRVLITDSPEEVTRSILRSATRRFGLKLQAPPARRSLGERPLHGHAVHPHHRRHRSGWRGLRPRPRTARGRRPRGHPPQRRAMA
jgi:hypothetical protein